MISALLQTSEVETEHENPEITMIMNVIDCSRTG
jgi:hypothetical protein